jgi:heme/copper-type cytochrome/quinol oxidase subunit 2
LGYLGIALPVLFLINNNRLLASMSHYYYTPGCIFFVGVLVAFALVLIAYEGHPMQKEGEGKEWMSDNLITTIAGVSILVAVIIPTSCEGSLDTLKYCGDPDYLFGHSNNTRGIFHLLGAGLFLVLLGVMCVYKFTRSKNPQSMKFHSVYKVCGYTVWICVLLILIIFVLESTLKFDFNDKVPGYTFWLETIAVIAFALAWLFKGKIDQDFGKLRTMLFGK